jgi:hypothetical protein
MPALAPGTLELGPLAIHSAGRVLRALHAAMEAADIDALVALFSIGADYDGVQGASAIRQYFRDRLLSADSRRVDLRVLRLERDGDAWRVTADLEVLARTGNATETLTSGRARLWLDERAAALKIVRVEFE